ncbi:MAG: diguanylate cyclase [Neobacillus sp.]|nr:diguanylate cyclase [Neobacillus sp.]
MLDSTNHPLYISIIDDDYVLRELLRKVIQIIEIEDYEVDFEEFSNGIEFFKSKRVNLPGKHLILLDGVMPVMDGLEVLQQLKKMDTSERIHVLMLSARKGEEHTSRALRLGATGYITKPFSIKDLQRTVLEIIKRMKINASE